jgi:hypothetical protein
MPPQVGWRPRGAGSTTMRRSSWRIARTAHGRPLSRKQLTPSTRLRLGADEEATVEEEERAVADHPCDQALGLCAADPAEVGDLRELLPGVLEGDAVAGEGHGEELVEEDRPAAVLRGDVLDPSGARELDEGDRLDDAVGRLAEEGSVGGLTGATSGAAHALQEGADGVGGLGLEDAVEVADVDAELERGGADDAGVGALIKAFLGDLPLLAGDGAVVDEHGGAGAAHVLGDGLGHAARLAEEQALRALGDPRRLAGDLCERGAVRDEQLAAARLPGGIDDARVAPRRTAQPGEDVGRVADGRAQADALQVVSRDAREPLDDAEHVRAAVGAGERVDLVDDDDPQVVKQCGCVDPLRDEHDLERLGRGH